MAKILATEGTPGMKKCAFCRYYYDPTNSVITPKKGQQKVWEYETGIKKPCRMKSNRETSSQNMCQKFSCKI